MFLLPQIFLIVLFSITPKGLANNSRSQTETLKELRKSILDDRPSEVQAILESAYRLDINKPVFEDSTFTLLHIAALKGNIKIMNLLLDKGADVHARDSKESTPLFYAVYSGNVQTVQFLVSRGADIHARNDIEQTPLHKAVLDPPSFIKPAKHKKQKKKWTSKEAGFVKIIKYLIAAGADKNAQDNRGDTPASLCVQYVNISSLEALLELGVDITVADFKNRTILHKAVGSISQNPNGTYGKRMKIFHMVLNAQEIKKIVNKQEIFGNTALHSAFYFNEGQSLAFLVNRLLEVEGINPLIRDRHGLTPRALAENKGLSDIAEQFKAFEKKKSETHDGFRFLNQPLCLGVCLTELDRTHKTHLSPVGLDPVKASSSSLFASQPRSDVSRLGERLHYFSTRGDHESIKDLFGLYSREYIKSFIDYSDSQGNRALLIAVIEGHPGVVKILIQFGADVNSKNNRGSSPLSQATVSGHLDMVSYFLSLPEIDVNTVDKNGWTPLYIASREDNSEMVLLLLSHKKTDKNKAINTLKQTAVHGAILSEAINAMQTLLSQGVDVNTVDSKNNTLLHFVLKAYMRTEVKKRMVELLLSYSDIDLRKRNNQGYTALNFSRQKSEKGNRHFHEITVLLESALLKSKPCSRVFGQRL